MTLHAGSWSSVPPRSALELLAPARDAETGIAAIDHGADAVYIGGPAFGARAAAGNSLEDIARLCEYAHRYRARVFAALNTLFTDAEIDAARQMAFDLARAGADVLIVQDMGLLMGELPDIELHASTQCDIRTPEKAAFLESAGFSQLVLARELSLTDIRAVRARLEHARIEFFVHGALCVSLSGQCWLSEAVTRRSANRGACSQLCRLPWDVSTLSGEVIARGKHVLSLKDNDQSDNLEALVDAGVSSFKIEGRLKDLAYVKNVTAWYRRRLDALLARRPDLSRASEGVSRFTFEPSPEKVFNRGKTDYFIHGRQFDKLYSIAALESPKHAGEPVGEVVGLTRDAVLVRAEPDVAFANGDGLTYLTETEEIRGLAVNRAEPAPVSGRDVWALHPAEPVRNLEGLREGVRLRRNRDHAFLRAIAGRTAERRIPVDLIFTAHEDGLDLVMTSGEDCASACVALALEAPSDRARNIESLKRQLSRLGDTPFEAANIFIPEDLDVFVPASVANELRRAAVAELERVRHERDLARRPRRAPWDDAAPFPEKTLGFRANVANALAKSFYAAHGARVLEPAFEIRPVANAPLMTCRHCVRAALLLCPKTARFFPEIRERTDRALLRPEPLILTASSGNRFRAEFHCKASPCEMTLTAEGEIRVARPRSDEAQPAPGAKRCGRDAPRRWTDAGADKRKPTGGRPGGNDRAQAPRGAHPDRRPPRPPKRGDRRNDRGRS